MKAENAFFRGCLREELSRRQERNGGYSLRAFARALGLAPSALSQVLSNKRVPSYKMARKILGALDLAPSDAEEFLRSVAAAKRSSGLKRVNPKLRELAGEQVSVQELSIELFRVIGDLHHYAILLLTRVEGFRSDPRWIAKQLGIQPTEARLAIDRLLQLELLKSVNGKLVAFQEHFTTADKSVTTAALRRHQRQVLEKAIHSLENDPIEDRSMTSMTMAVDPRRLAEAKRRVEKFTNEICQYLEGGRRTQVYELGVCLYPLQKKEMKS